MNPGIGPRLKRMAKVLATVCAIEVCLPGGTLLALGYLLALQCHLYGSTEGEPAVPTWRGLRGLLAANPAGGSNRVDATSAGPATATRGAASDGPSGAGES